MNHEVERKFLICTLPNLQGYQPIRYERYFLFKNKYVEIRVQKKGDRYEFERKETINNLSARKEKISITRDEFNSLIKNCTDIIIRDSFNISKTPNITLKVYGGKYTGLNRVEVEFQDEKEATNFIPPTWFGKEITKSPLGRDSKLLDLSEDEMNKLRK